MSCGVRRKRLAPKYSLIYDVEIGEGTIIHDHVNLYKCRIGRNCKIDAYVYIEEGVVIGDNCKVRPFVFIPIGVTIENNVFVGPNVSFANDKYPKARGDWRFLPIKVREGASIGANSVILPGITVGKYALVGAGSVVTRNVPDYAVVTGNPARVVGYTNSPEFQEKLRKLIEESQIGTVVRS